MPPDSAPLALSGPLDCGARQGNLSGMRPAPSPRPVPVADRPLITGRDALRRAGGFVLLGCSLWLVVVLAFFRAIAGLFS